MSSKANRSLPVVAAEDYRHAVAGELWELRPVAIAGPIEYRSSPRANSPEAIRYLAETALQTPIDFPAIGNAILDGDHVALAVDPNVPRLGEVIAGVLRVMNACGAGRVSIVLWPEACQACYQTLHTRFQNDAADAATENNSRGHSMTVTVTRHTPRDRSEMRYVAADAAAEAVYLARELVDADFAIPIVAARSIDAVEGLDRANVFPMFADASTMQRFQLENSKQEFEAMAREVGWLLGVQLILLVSSDASGNVARIISGTPDSIRGELDTLHAEEKEARENETRPQAGLIVAALDGDASVQTWANVARAVIAASRHVEGEGTIVIWSELSQAPSAIWQREITRCSDADDSEHADEHSAEHSQDSPSREFADWSSEAALARRLGGLLQSHRIFLHSELADDEVESLGLGVLASVEELSRLGQAFQGAGVLRAAQFQDASIVRFPSPSN